jgi:hypothetical protein
MVAQPAETAGNALLESEKDNARSAVSQLRTFCRLAIQRPPLIEQHLTEFVNQMRHNPAAPGIEIIGSYLSSPAILSNARSVDLLSCNDFVSQASLY